MPTIICVAIIAEFRHNQIAKVLGKRRLIECGQEMERIEDFKWSCPQGHIRYYPPQEREFRTNIVLTSLLKIPMGSHELVFYKDVLRFLSNFVK